MQSLHQTCRSSLKSGIGGLFPLSQRLNNSWYIACHLLHPTACCYVAMVSLTWSWSQHPSSLEQPTKACLYIGRRKPLLLPDFTRSGPVSKSKLVCPPKAALAKPDKPSSLQCSDLVQDMAKLTPRKYWERDFSGSAPSYDALLVTQCCHIFSTDF